MMNRSSLRGFLFTIITAIFVLNTITFPLQAQGTSITFSNMEIEPDDVNNYGGVRLVVFFWDKCHACIEEVSTLKLIDQEYNITIIMINVIASSVNNTNLEFIEQTDIPEEWVLGYITPETEVTFAPNPVPVTIVLDEEGRIAADIGGVVSYRFLEQCIINAIDQNIEEYFTERTEDPGGYASVIFIVIGVIVSAVVIYFLVKSFLQKKNLEKS